MWLAVESVKNKETDIVVSAGNTGALLVISKLNLKMIENIDKPALSALWPNKKGMSVVLDLGANIECSSKNLLDFSIMGASLYTSLYPGVKPNVGLLNIGSEELKGNETIKETYQTLNDKKSDNYNFSGYIEGNHLMDGEVNVIVSDGFTGNIALKTAEGTANFITDELKKAMTGSLIGKISSLLNISNLNKFKKRLDPRLYNGAIYLARQYKTIAIVGVDVLVIVSVAFSPLVGLGYLVGAALSGIAGYVGMLVSVEANVRTAEASRKGLAQGLSVAFKSGAVTGMLVAGLALLAIAVYYYYYLL